MQLHIMEALDNYEKTGAELGNFLNAVVKNDLGAVCLADAQNLRDIADIYRYVFNHLNSDCWGSKEKVSRWRQKKALEYSKGESSV